MSHKLTELTISRDCGYVMRGIAIMMIVFHNYCHSIQGVTSENEFEFFYGNVTSLMTPKATALNWFFDIMSFFGWYGVPVFMFLSGYGLVMKYELGGTYLKAGRFLWHNYLKLFFLMLPGIVSLTMITLSIAIPNGHLGARYIIDYVCQSSMLPDVVYPWWKPNPGVFWYFGVTMEFYALYALMIYRKPKGWLWACVVLSVALQLVTPPESETMTWIRHNVTGWTTVFVMGVLYGRTSRIQRGVAVIIVVLSAAFILPSMLNWITWQFSILACVVIAIVLAKWSMRIPGWRRFWIWIGRLSPMLFVAHPVARDIIFKTIDLREPALFPLSVYLCITFLLALVFRYFATVCCRRWLK